MAHIERRVRKDGTKTYRVKWRLGGTRTGHPESETFADSGGSSRGDRRAAATSTAGPDEALVC